MASTPNVVTTLAHSEGLTRLAFSRDGRFIFTGGMDTIIRVFDASAPVDSEPALLQDQSDAITYLDCSSSQLIVSCMDATVRRYKLDTAASGSSIDFAGLVARAQGMPVRCAVMDPTGKRIAYASDDLRLQVLAASADSTLAPLTLTGHSKPPRGLAWSPDGAFLLSTDCDGMLLVWDASGSILDPIEEEEDSSWQTPKLIKTLEGIFSSSDPDDLLSTTPVWHPAGKLFVMASKTHEPLMIQRDSWARIGTFREDGHDCAVAELAFSPNGRYLASSGVNGQILVWDTSTRSTVSRYTPPGPRSEARAVTSLAFSPTSNLLAFADVRGNFGRWNSPIPSGRAHPVQIASARAARARSPLFGNDELDIENRDDVSRTSERDNGDRGNEDDGVSLGADHDDETVLGEDWIIDDDDEEGAFAGLKGLGGAQRPDDTRGWGKSSSGREVVNVTKAQTAFQPGSTVMRGKKRYLAFNMVGAIDVTDQDTHHLVSVDFHDSGRRRPFHFQDYHKFEMGALGEQGAIFASLPEGTIHPSMVHYRPFDAWSSSSQWIYSLPKSEVAVAIAVGGSFTLSSSSSSSRLDEATGFVIVATNKGYLRFLTGSGVQRYLWRLGEDVVSMVGGASTVLVVHREGGTSLDGCQNLRYTLIDLETFDIVQEGRLPLGRHNVIKWIGFSDEGVPAFYDSHGILSILDRSRRPGQARWIPLLDSNTLARRQGKQESYWPVGLHGDKFMAVILKGAETSPFFPRPLISDLDINMPLLNMSDAHGQLEESHLRRRIEATTLLDAVPASNITDIHMLQVSMDKDLLQLIQHACKADKLSRALDTARMLNLLPSVDSAAQIASFYHLPGLKEKIVALKMIKEKKFRNLDNEAYYRSRRSTSYHTLSSIDIPPAAYNPSSSANQPRGVQDFTPRPPGGKRTFAGAAPTTNSLQDPPSRLTMDSTQVGDDESLPDDDGAQRGDAVTEETMDIDGQMESNGASKRRREDEDVSIGDFASLPRKKVAADESGPAPFKSAPKNPFAKKDISTATSNPFARPPAGKAITVGKSQSFFERVDESEKASKSKPSKSSSNGSAKQTTLFGLVPPAAGDMKSQARRPKKAVQATAASEDEDVDKDATIRPETAGEGDVDVEEMAETQRSGDEGEEALTSDATIKSTKKSTASKLAKFRLQASS